MGLPELPLRAIAADEVAHECLVGLQPGAAHRQRLWIARDVGRRAPHEGEDAHVMARCVADDRVAAAPMTAAATRCDASPVEEGPVAPDLSPVPAAKSAACRVRPGPDS